MVSRFSSTLVCSAAALAILSCGSTPDDALRAVGPTAGAITPDAVVTDGYTLKKGGQPCILPWGIDVNEALGADVQILAGFCTTITALQHYAVIMIVGFNSPEGLPGLPLVYPPDYTPWTDDPLLDFFAKLESVTYVVHPLGNSFTFSAKQLARYTYASTMGDVFAGAGFMPPEWYAMRARTLLPPLPPVRAGAHTVDLIISLAAPWCDGTSAVTNWEPGMSGPCIPAGTNLLYSLDGNFVERP